jgi:hypothetical protein
MVTSSEAFPDSAQAVMSPEGLGSSDVGKTCRGKTKPGELAYQVDLPLHLGFARGRPHDAHNVGLIDSEHSVAAQTQQSKRRITKPRQLAHRGGRAAGICTGPVHDMT